jgi:hypothetical protein
MSNARFKHRENVFVLFLFFLHQILFSATFRARDIIFQHMIQRRIVVYKVLEFVRIG